MWATLGVLHHKANSSKRVGQIPGGIEGLEGAKDEAVDVAALCDRGVPLENHGGEDQKPLTSSCALSQVVD